MNPEKRPGGPETPWDWNDLEGWDRYYRSYPAIGTPKIGQTEIGALADFCDLLPDLLTQGVRKVWFPGCGVSVVPGVFAACGLEVWASDAAPEAIALLESWPDVGEWVPKVLARFAPRFHASNPYRPGTLHLSVHDFRTPFETNNLDCIFNVLAFHGLDAADMDAAARIHWAALKPNGIAYFHTWKLEASVREIMETSLCKAGFSLPYRATEAWLRTALDAAGIDYMLRGSVPMVRGMEDWEERQRQEEALSLLREEYRSRQEQELPQIRTLREDGSSKIAQIVNST